MEQIDKRKKITLRSRFLSFRADGNIGLIHFTVGPVMLAFGLRAAPEESANNRNGHGPLLVSTCPYTSGPLRGLFFKFFVMDQNACHGQILTRQ